MINSRASIKQSDNSHEQKEPTTDTKICAGDNSCMGYPIRQCEIFKFICKSLVFNASTMHVKQKDSATKVSAVGLFVSVLLPCTELGILHPWQLLLYIEEDCSTKNT